MDDDRLTMVETKLLYLEKTVHELDGLVYEVSRETASLGNAVRELSRRLSELARTGAPGPLDGERPPHY